MTLMRRLRFHFTLLSLVGMLLAQWSVAAYACTLPHRAPASAPVVMADCEEHQVAAPTPLCVRHCAGDQGGSTVYAAALIAPPSDERAVFRLPAVATPQTGRIATATTPLPGRPPPLHILLQRFLT